MHGHKMDKKPAFVFVFIILLIRYYARISVVKIVFPLSDSTFTKAKIHAALNIQCFEVNP